MSRSRLVVVALAAPVALAGLVGCGDDGSGGPAVRLEEQVAALLGSGADDVRVRLETLGVSVERSALEQVAADDVRCPTVDQPDAGDRATCEVALAPADVLVDVEFGADGAPTVVRVEVAEVRGGAPEVEGAVRELVAGRLDGAADEVTATCPGVEGLDDVEVGAVLRCRVAVADGAALPVELTVDDDGALVLASAVLDRAGVEAFLAGELEGAAQGPVAVACGEEPLIVSAVGGSLACEAVRTADGETFDVRVVVRSVDGELEYSVSGR